MGFNILILAGEISASANRTGQQFICTDWLQNIKMFVAEKR
jgi:hypothetical protein